MVYQLMMLKDEYIIHLQLMMNRRIVEKVNDQLNMLSQDDYYPVVVHVFFRIEQEMFE